MAAWTRGSHAAPVRRRAAVVTPREADRAGGALRPIRGRAATGAAPGRARPMGAWAPRAILARLAHEPQERAP